MNTISKERELELAKKYGVDVSVLNAIEEGKASSGQIQQESNTFEHAIINKFVDTDDVAEIVLILAVRFGISEDKYNELMAVASADIPEDNRRWDVKLILHPDEI